LAIENEPYGLHQEADGQRKEEIVHIRDVAKKARVSVATVSRTLNNVGSVDARLAKRVRNAVKELGYFPNRQARALVSGKSRVFGLVVSEITNPFFPEIVQTFETLAVENGYEILLTSTVYDPQRMEIAVRRMIEARVDGVAVLTFGMEDALLQHLRVRELPLVFVDVGPRAPRVTNIRVDYLHGIQQAIRHLAALGHERIGFICGPTELRSARARLEAFEQSMAGVNLKVRPEYIVQGGHKLEGGKLAYCQLSRLHDRPTALLCSNDMTAIGVIRQAYEQGLSVPDDLSVVGFDDTRLADYIVPPLTTIQMSQKDLAQIAFRALLEECRRKVPAPEGTEYVLTTHFVLRRSTDFPPKAEG